MTDRHKYFFRCNDCKREYLPGEVTYLCPECSKNPDPSVPPYGILKTVYPYSSVPGDFDELLQVGFLPLLPLKSDRSLPFLKIGDTPLYRVPFQQGKSPVDIFLKDDSQNPTFSFKDRASALVSAIAKESGIQTIITASTGNAGSSMAGICAAQKQKAIVVVPAAAPLNKLVQIMACGARLIPVNGTYDQAFDLSIRMTEQYGFYNRNTAYNPFTIEGKKTVSFELFHQLGGRIPDRIFIPAGDGVITAGVYKGFEDLLHCGIIRKMPQMVVVQAEGSDNLVRNIGKEVFESRKSGTLADSISVDIPRNFRMAERYILEYGGTGLTVTDEEIIRASGFLSGQYGLFAEPAAAAAMAGLLKWTESHELPVDEFNVVMLTGSGLKDTKPLSRRLTMPEPFDPGIDNLL